MPLIQMKWYRKTQTIYRSYNFYAYYTLNNPIINKKTFKPVVAMAAVEM